MTINTMELTKDQTVSITEDVTLHRFPSGQAALEVGDNAIEFRWTEEVAEVFSEIDSVNAFEFLAVVSRNTLRF